MQKVNLSDPRLFEVTVACRAIGKARPRRQSTKGKSRIGVFVPDKYTKAKRELAALVLDQLRGSGLVFPLGGELGLNLLIRRAMKRGRTPDVDNLAGFVMDALNWSESEKRGVWRDDCQIKSLSVDVRQAEEDSIRIVVYTVTV